ncbi:hypothetical protein D3C75_1320200 [compost metagenome]
MCNQDKEINRANNSFATELRSPRGHVVEGQVGNKKQQGTCERRQNKSFVDRDILLDDGKQCRQ